MAELSYRDGTVRLFQGDCLPVLAGIADGSIDAIVTDPPYALGFMGKEWDSHGSRFQEWCEQWSAECLRVLKPGAHMLAFGSPRTYHRLACAVEDAGFEIRDSIHWIYASGFPKGQDVAKGVGRIGDADGAIPWQGWNTALKPAHEPIAVARKSTGLNTVAANVLEHGTGALNIGACRITAGPDYYDKCAFVVGLGSNRNGATLGEWTGIRQDSSSDAGRWPTNFLFSHAPGCVVVGHRFAAGDARAGSEPGRRPGGFADIGADKGQQRPNGALHGAQTVEVFDCEPGCPVPELGDRARFFPVFRYQAKAPACERPRLPDGTVHPCVKPLSLMRWLVRLVTPAGGTVLDPFAGSGTTLQACTQEGFGAIGIEREASYIQLCRMRLEDAR